MFIFDNKSSNKNKVAHVKVVLFLICLLRGSTYLVNIIMEIIKLITHALSSAFGSYFSSDMDVMSKEAKIIFSNKEDREKYINAVEKLRDASPNTEETIILSNKEKITLIS